jgi:hypothetical protein
MSSFAMFEIGMSPPGSYFKWGDIPMGGSWPSGVRETLIELGGKTISPSERVTFELPQQLEVAKNALEQTQRMEIEVVLDYRNLSNPSVANIHSEGWYSGSIDVQSEGFVGGNLFLNQLQCNLPKPDPVIGHDAGCGLRKKQLLKLQVSQSKRIKASDVLEPCIDPLVWSWQVLVVSSRFREALIDSGMTGFSFLPIAGERASSKDLLLSSGSCASDSNDWFQWVIHGRTKPIPIRDFIGGKRGSCEICGRISGDAQPYYLSQPLKPDNFDTRMDVQICENLELPNSKKIMCTEGRLILSSKFVELCVKERFRGLTGLKGNSACFSAIYLGPTVD